MIKMNILAFILLAQLALVYTDVSHLPQNYLPPSQPHMERVSPVDGMRTTMTFEQHELQELPEEIEYVEQLGQQQPAVAMNQQMLQQYAANMQYVTPVFQAPQPQAATDVEPNMLPMDYMSKQMEQQQQHQQSDGMPQMQQDMLATIQFMPPAMNTAEDMYPEQQSHELYQNQLMRRLPEMSEQRMEMMQAMRSADVLAMQQRLMTSGQHQNAEQLSHILANDGYHYKTIQNEGLRHR